MPSPKPLRNAFSNLAGVRLVRGLVQPEFEVSFADSPEPAEDAPLLEPGEFRAISCPAAEESGFTHFVDGAQKSRLAFWHYDMPGALAHVSAAIALRVSKEMSVASEVSPELPSVFGITGSEALGRAAELGWPVVWCDCPEGSGMTAMQEVLTKQISSERQKLEERLIHEWLRTSTEGWLLVDGGIGGPASHFPGNTRVVGVVKSHKKQYFRSRSYVQTVLSLHAGERTTAFRTSQGKDERAPVMSWYLRLHESEYESPAFGLVRVEMQDSDEARGWIDSVASWLLAERSPLSLPDARFDRMLYPIRWVEMYLKAKQPSDASFLGWIGA